MNSIISLLPQGIITLLAGVGLWWTITRVHGAITKEELDEHCKHKHALVNLDIVYIKEGITGLKTTQARMFEALDDIKDYLLKQKKEDYQ